MLFATGVPGQLCAPLPLPAPLDLCPPLPLQIMHGGLFSEDGVTLDDIRKIERNRQPPDSGGHPGWGSLPLPSLEDCGRWGHLVPGGSRLDLWLCSVAPFGQTWGVQDLPKWGGAGTGHRAI